LIVDGCLIGFLEIGAVLFHRVLVVLVFDEVGDAGSQSAVVGIIVFLIRHEQFLLARTRGRESFVAVFVVDFVIIRFWDVGTVDAVVSGRQFRGFVTARAAVLVTTSGGGVGVGWCPVLGASAGSASGNAVRILVRNGDARAVADVVAFEWWHFRLEHVHGHDVDDHDPAGAVEQFEIVLGEGDGRNALHLQLATVRIGALQFARHILLEFLHVEQEETLSEFESALRQFEDIVANAVLVGRVLDVNVALGDAFDVDVAFLVHAHFGALTDVPLGFLRFVVPHRVVETVQPNSKSVEAVVTSVDLNGNGAGVSFGYAPVALHDDQLGPNLVVDLVPFVQHLLNVILVKFLLHVPDVIFLLGEVVQVEIVTGTRQNAAA